MFKKSLNDPGLSCIREPRYPEHRWSDPIGDRSHDVAGFPTIMLGVADIHDGKSEPADDQGTGDFGRTGGMNDVGRQFNCSNIFAKYSRACGRSSIIIGFFARSASLKSG